MYVRSILKINTLNRIQKQKKKGFASIKDLKEVGSYDHKKKPFCIGLKFDSRLLLVSFDSEGLKDEWLVEFKKIQPQELGKEVTWIILSIPIILTIIRQS